MVPGRRAKGTCGEYRKTGAYKICKTLLGALPKPSWNHSELQGKRHLPEGFFNVIQVLRQCCLSSFPSMLFAVIGIQGDEEPRSGRHLSRLQSTMIWKMALQTRCSACSACSFIALIFADEPNVLDPAARSPVLCGVFYYTLPSAWPH